MFRTFICHLWRAVFVLLPYFASAVQPEREIVIIEDFISSDTAKALIHFYDSEKKNLSQHTDNQVAFSFSTDPYIRELISSISNQVLDVLSRTSMRDSRGLHIDHCALYARIEGNYCPYHADNTYFNCPIHGKDQSRLRMLCNGSCPGAKFFPNHTPWREYTALVYLNDDFEGGEIAFEDGPCNKLYRTVIPIKAYMLVLAPNGPHFYYEVLPIRSGTRYSLHFWYTSDPSHHTYCLN